MERNFHCRDLFSEYPINMSAIIAIYYFKPRIIFAFLYTLLSMYIFYSNYFTLWAFRSHISSVLLFPICPKVTQTGKIQLNSLLQKGPREI